MSSLMRAVLVAALATSTVAAQFTSPQADKAKGSFYIGSYGLVTADDGEVVALGAPLDSLSRGAVYVYRVVGDSLVHEQTLENPAPQANDLFGQSVVVDGDAIAVGAPGTANFQFNDDGEAFVYRFDGDSWEVELALVDFPLGYGESVGLDGDLLVVGDPNDDTSAGNGGALYVYRRTGGAWDFEEKIRGTQTNGSLGEHVAAQGEWILGGGNFDVLKVYRREGSLWTNPQSLDTEHDALALDGDLAVVGRLGDFHDVEVYRLRCGTWEYETTLVDPFAVFTSFGGSVSLSDDAILVGAASSSQFVSSGGAAHVFRHDGADWVLEQSLSPSDGHGHQRFGTAVGLAGELALVGAPRDDETWNDSGAAYLFTAAPATPRWQDLGAGLAGFSSPELDGLGTLVGGEPVTFSLACAEPFAVAALILGFTQVNAPFKGGVLVPSPDVVIPGLPVDANGELSLPTTMSSGVPSGASLVFQFWVTDAGGPAGLSATNGLLATAP